MSTNNVSQDTLDRLSEVIDDVETAADVSERLGISRTHAYRALAALGVSKLERDSEKTKRVILPLYGDGLTISEISKETGISVAHIRRTLKNASIKLDDRGARSPYRPRSFPIAQLDPIWAREFCGLFYADGCAVISETSHNTLRPYMVIRLRADNKPLLDDIHSKLGGGMSYSTKKNDIHKNARPQWSWYVTGWSPCRSVIEATSLDVSLLSAKKAKDVSIIYQAILARWEMPHILGEENKNILREYKERLQDVKVFRL